MIIISKYIQDLTAGNKFDLSLEKISFADGTSSFLNFTFVSLIKF